MKRLRFVTLSAALLALLSACGGGGGSGTPATQEPPPVVTPPASTVDVFFKAVLAVIGMSSDDTEPADIAATAATTPDNTEPEKVE